MALRTLLFTTLAIGATNQTFEPTNFNVTQALAEQGVNLAALPELASLIERSSNSACYTACSSLQIIYGADSISYHGEAEYETFTTSYWSQNLNDVKPYCVFRPSTPSAVSVLVLVSRLSQCPFAVKSGGHAPFAGASSIEGGITVSFENLKAIKPSADKKTVAVQPGNTWGRVLSALNTTDVTVLSGRIGDIGVGGLTLGGGLSFLSNEYGLVCDNVASFDVVTASGLIINASPTQHPDLFWALRGGGNNFGIVVGFHYQTKPLPGDQLFGGTRTFPEAAFPQVAKAYVDLTLNSASDPKAGSWVVFINSNGQKLAMGELWYGAPLAKGSDAPIFADFYRIDAVSDTTQTRGHAQYILDNEARNAYGERQVTNVLSVRASHALAARTIDIFYDGIGALAGVEGAFPALVWQQITEGSLKGSVRNGGNPMGLDPAGGPLHIIELVCSWTDARDDELVYKTMSDINRQIKEESIKLGVDSDWLYMNYASQFQDVVASYGAENKAKMKRVAEKYDPRRVFQMLQPGYFKLDRAPVSKSG
ncbi:fad binding domain containing protein [Apiospora saccharicola]|uniref:Fad binding domain containing protein n=1 Tax=Apiospora saccharicola TaxID=335842 RepID=A0ABR1W489_9PEZI